MNFEKVYFVNFSFLRKNLFLKKLIDLFFYLFELCWNFYWWMINNKDNIVYFLRYGDKSLRLFFGCLFGVFWIFIGLVVIIMFIVIVMLVFIYSFLLDFINVLEGLKVSGVE